MFDEAFTTILRALSYYWTSWHHLIPIGPHLDAKIHDIFHISCLKLELGAHNQLVSTLPPISSNESILARTHCIFRSVYEVEANLSNHRALGTMEGSRPSLDCKVLISLL